MSFPKPARRAKADVEVPRSAWTPPRAATAPYSSIRMARTIIGASTVCGSVVDAAWFT